MAESQWILSVDPGNTCGFALAEARLEDTGPLVHHIGSLSPNDMLDYVERRQSLLDRVLIERPPRQGEEDLLLLVGQLMHAARPIRATHRPNISLVYPSVWKNYPTIKRNEILHRIASPDRQGANVHERDALNMLAWWLAVECKDQVDEEE